MSGAGTRFHHPSHLLDQVNGDWLPLGPATWGNYGRDGPGSDAALCPGNPSASASHVEAETCRADRVLCLRHSDDSTQRAEAEGQGGHKASNSHAEVACRCPIQIQIHIHHRIPSERRLGARVNVSRASSIKPLPALALAPAPAPAPAPACWRSCTIHPDCA